MENSRPRSNLVSSDRAEKAPVYSLVVLLCHTCVPYSIHVQYEVSGTLKYFVVFSCTHCWKPLHDGCSA